MCGCRVWWCLARFSAMTDGSVGGDEDPVAMNAPTCYTCVCGTVVERISVGIRPTTGGQFVISIPADESVEHLRLMVSQKLRVPRERICLLYRNKPLRSGTLLANQVQHGCHVTLLPSVETGLVSHRPELSVLQALENLTPTQVIEFLSGKAPLNLTVRLGDHMMLIQLQLSPAPTAPRRATTTTNTSSTGGNTNRNSAARCSQPVLATRSAATPSVCAGVSQPTERRTCYHQRVPVEQHATPTTCTARAQLDMRALTEASRNLTRTLKQLSSEVLTDGWASPLQPRPTFPAVRPTRSHQEREDCTSSKTSSQADDRTAPTVCSSSSSSAVPPSSASVVTSARSLRPGAIIETMHHHGKGVYSGTFSGTLNPALQDRMGRPKRDIGTIIHILNDLLCAAPQYRAPDPSRGQQEPTGHVSSDPAFDPLTASTAKVGEERSVGEEQATRGKVEHLKMVMEERRQRRQQRRTHPYTTSWSATHETTTARIEGATSTANTDHTADKCTDSVDSDMNDVTSPALVTCGGQDLM